MSEADDLKDIDETRPYPAPPATFEFLVRSVVFQVELSLGMMHFGEEKDRPKPDLEMSRHHIDLLAMLQQKTRGNLSLDEQRLLENALTELRFRFVQAAEDSKRSGTATPSESASATEFVTSESPESQQA